MIPSHRLPGMLDFLSIGAEVKRYHTHTTLREETVGHHSHGVALLCLLLRPDASARLLRAALLHDMAEQVTGDIPSPAKRLYGLSEQVHEREVQVLESSLWYWPELDADERRVLKFADLAQGALFCHREIELGNSRFSAIYDRYMHYYRSLLPPSGPDTPESVLFTALQELYHESIS